MEREGDGRKERWREGWRTGGKHREMEGRMNGERAGRKNAEMEGRLEG